MFPTSIGNAKRTAFGVWIANACETNAIVFQESPYFVVVFVGNLNDDTWIFGKQLAHNVVALHIVQVDVQTTFRICKSHFEQRCNHTTSRNIVSCKNPTAANHLLNGIEAIAEVARLFHGRNVRTNLAQALCKGRTAQTLLVEAEINVIKACILVVYQYWRNHLAHVAHLCTA